MDLRNGVQVGGKVCFPESHWKRGIAFFLEKVIWKGEHLDTYGERGKQDAWIGPLEPKLALGGPGGITIRLRKDWDYAVEGRAAELPPQIPLEKQIRVVNPEAPYVERGLARFIWNPRTRMLILHIVGGTVRIWKKQRPGHYGVCFEPE